MARLGLRLLFIAPLSLVLPTAACGRGDGGGLGLAGEPGFGDSGGADGASDGQSPPAEVATETSSPPTDVAPDDETSDAETSIPDVTKPIGPAVVSLGAAGRYAVLAKSAISNVPTSAITGDLAVSPAAATLITGFPLTRAGTKWTCPEVVGSVFAADNDPPTPADLTLAVANMETAYTDAASRPTPGFVELGAGAIGGMKLTPGLYKWTSTVTIATDLTLSGGPDDVWIFQVTGALKVSSGASMILSGGARAKNIFWQVAGFVDLAKISHAEGIVLTATSINLAAGASINGRLLAQTAIDISSATITAPAP